MVSNGFHTGLVIPRAALAEEASRAGETALADVTDTFGAYAALEIGWGEESMYRFTPTLASLDAGRAFRALFLDNRTVLHVVGLDVAARAAFPRATLAAIPLSSGGFARLAEALDDTLVRDDAGMAVDLGPGLYGPSRFFRAKGRSSLRHVCNTWVGQLLNAAGLPNAPLPSIVAAGLLADLRLRSGIVPSEPGP